MIAFLPSLSFSLFPSSSSCRSAPSTALFAAHPTSSLQKKNLSLQYVSFNGVRIPVSFTFCRNTSLIVRASSEKDGQDAGEPTPPPEESVSVENLPLESKLQMRLEQRLKMKLAKKIRLRRKRLVRKRQLRKKGRWPPSKMKKLKNV